MARVLFVSSASFEERGHLSVKTETAAMLRVNRLYHYQPYKADWLRRTIQDDAIYFSNPNDFNDPWDCRPRYNEDALNDAAYCKRLVDWLDAVARKWAGSGFDEHAHKEKINQLHRLPSLLREHLLKAADEREKEIHKRYRVYCLVPRADCALMWAHYADKHRGVCLEFAHDARVFDSTYKVVYCEEYPQFDPGERDIGKILLPLITKSVDWKYEEEYRAIAQDKEKRTPHDTLITENNYFSLPAKMAESVILGALIARCDEDEIRKMVAERTGHPIVLKRAVRVPNRYGLSIERC
jgi:Protein of unknown function (DUF2971)